MSVHSNHRGTVVCLPCAVRPADHEELFNLRHATLRNIVEQTFGIFKRRFAVTATAPEYPLKFQVELIPALCALHNFILTHDPNNNAIGHWVPEDGLSTSSQQSTHGGHDEEGDDDIQDVETVVQGSITEEERTRTGQRRDELAQQMWDDYLEYIGHFEN